MIKRIFAAIMVVAFLFGTAACGSVDTSTSVVAVRTGGGPFEDQSFKDCVPAGTHQNMNSPGDKYYFYPISDRDYDRTGQSGSDGDPFTVVSSDNVEMAVPVTIRFNLISDCETLQKLHVAHGERYQASLDDDGTSSEGWLLMLRKLMGDPVDSALDEVAKDFTWAELYNNAEAQNELQATITDNIDEIVKVQAKGEFFDNFVVLVKKPTPVDPALTNTIAKTQDDLAKSKAAIAKAKADEAAAKAEVAVAQAQAAKKAAEIEGYGGFENYNKAQAVEKGLNPYQPTYKVSGTN